MSRRGPHTSRGGPHTSRAASPQPILDFEISSDRNETVIFASACVQGWRPYMEDRNVCELQEGKKDRAAFFAIFDGHNGHQVAQYASENLLKRIMSNQAYPTRMPVAIERACFIIDNEMRSKIKPPLTKAGSTAIIVAIIDDKLFCGNVGDSRATSFTTSNRTEDLSVDHKPSLPLELSRIRYAGGYVADNRVDGILAMSRSLGDYVFKADTSLSYNEQKVISVPDVVEKDLDTLQYIVLASDGVWDVMSSSEVCTFINQQIQLLKEPKKIVKSILQNCLGPREQTYGMDNMTIILILVINNLSAAYKNLLRIESDIKDPKVETNINDTKKESPKKSEVKSTKSAKKDVKWK